MANKLQVIIKISRNFCRECFLTIFVFLLILSGSLYLLLTFLYYFLTEGNINLQITYFIGVMIMIMLSVFLLFVYIIGLTNIIGQLVSDYQHQTQSNFLTH